MEVLLLFGGLICVFWWVFVNDWNHPDRHTGCVALAKLGLIVIALIVIFVLTLSGQMA